MDFPRRVVVPKEAPRENGDDVLLVVDVRHGDLLGLRVDVVREGLVADAREAVPDETGRDGAGEVEGEKDRVEEGDRCACWMEREVREGWWTRGGMTDLVSGLLRSLWLR